jgi:hypothetical protein
MLHEFKRPMWNDGYSKEQPWLNYFNSYERMHCCFDGDGGDDDDGGAGDEAASTSGAAGASSSTDDVGAADDEAASTSGGTGASSSTGDGGAAGESLAGGAGTDTMYGGEGSRNTTDVGAADDEAANTSGGIGGTGGGTGGGWGEPDISNPEDFSWSASKGFTAPSVTSATTADDLETIGVDNITDLATMEAMYNNPDAYGVGYNDFVDMGFFEKSAAADYEREKAAAAALQASYRDKGKDVSISVAKDGTYSYTGKDAGTVGLSEMGKGAGLLGQTFGVGSVMGALDRAFGTTDEKAGISTVAGGEYYGGLREEGITSQQEKDSKGGSDYSIGQYDPGADYSDFQSTSQQNEDETFGEDETDEGVDDTDTDTDTFIPTPEPEEEAPETAMEAYFRKLGIASPALTVPSTSPSSFQGYPSYLPPIGPAANAAYRRKLALGTPRYQEPSGPNPSISTLAAAYGISYEEAAKKFAPPSVPAMGGGGLRGLMEYS